jgi:hypothetical protein
LAHNFDIDTIVEKIFNSGNNMNSKYLHKIDLVHGFKNKENNLIKKVQLRALDGFDEEFITNMDIENDGTRSSSSYYSYPIKTTILLSRIISFYDIDDQYKKYTENEKIDIVKKMTIGDRVLIILYLRKITFGDTFQIEFQCNFCKNFMSIDLSIQAIINNTLSTIQNKHYENVCSVYPKYDYYKFKFSDLDVKIRLLNGQDQENISLQSDDIDENKLLESCIINLDSIGCEKLLDENFQAKINSVLTELDPLSDILLTLVCPNCNTSIKTLFIVEDFFFKEIKSRMNNLKIELHWLAFNYNWTEYDILSLPLPKRKRYVQIGNSILEGELGIG